MAVLLATGLMNVWSMALIALALTAERAIPRSLRVTRVVGLAIVSIGLILLGRALGVEVMR